MASHSKSISKSIPVKFHPSKLLSSRNDRLEQSFSVMRRLKNYLRSTMNQSRLNHIMVLHIYKELVDGFDLNAIANEFTRESEHRLSVFGKF